MILAQAAAAAGDWTGIVALGLNAGFAGLVGWYLLTKAIPKMQDQHQAGVAAARQEHHAASREARTDYLAVARENGEAVRESRTAFLNALEALRVWYDAREQRVQQEARGALQAVIDHCEREATRRDQTVRSDLALVQKALGDVRETLEEVRDVARPRPV